MKIQELFTVEDLEKFFEQERITVKASIEAGLEIHNALADVAEALVPEGYPRAIASNVSSMRQGSGMYRMLCTIAYLIKDKS